MAPAQLDKVVDGIESVTVTELKERTREVIGRIADHKPVAILRHKAPAAVLISAADYAQFEQLKRERLDLLAQRYDDMVLRMQTAEAAAGVDTLFNATPAELGQAAVRTAKRG
jgi:prevent-host-death family protein